MKKTSLIILFVLSTFSTLFAQENCSTAALASEGKNNAPALYESWSTFTMPSGKAQKLVISSSEPNTYLYLNTGSCESLVYKGSGYGANVFASLDFSPGETVFITWYNYSIKEFQWSLQTADPGPGDNCELAIDAITADAGMNSVQNPDIDTYWFKTVAPSTPKKIVINTTSTPGIVIFQNDCSDLAYIASRTSSIEAIVQPNEPIYIAFNTNFAKSFNWSLSYEDIGPGDNCEQAIEVSPGNKIVGSGSAQNTWYKITTPPQPDMKLVFDSGPYYFYFYVYDGDCDNYFYLDFAYNNGYITGLPPGQELFVQVQNYGYPDLEWSYEFQPIVDGDLCTIPIAAVEGINEHSMPSSGVVWYEFTMPDQPDRILRVTSNDFSLVRLYTDTNCDEDMEAVQSEYSSLLSGVLQPGAHVLISFLLFDPNEHFNFTLSVERLQGQTCTDPIEATPGINHTESSPRWFRYVMPYDGDLTLSSLEMTDADTRVYVYTNCDALPIASADDSKGTLQSELKLTNLVEGQEILIVWYYSIISAGTQLMGEIAATGPPQYGFDWTLKISQEIAFDEVVGKKYGDDPFPLVATSTSGLPVTFSIISGPGTINGGVLTINGAGDITIRAAQVGNDSYAQADFVERTFHIQKASLTITAQDLTVPYNQPYPPLQRTYTGFISDDDASDLDVLPTISTAPLGSAPDTYPITLAGGSDNNYLYDLVPGVLTITKLSQGVTIDDPGKKQVTDAPFFVSGSADSGLPLTFTVLEGPGFLSGNVLTLDGKDGTIVLQAEQAGNDFYLPASAVAYITVADLSKLPANLAVNPTTNHVYGSQVTLNATSNSTQQISFVLLSGPANLTGNLLTFTGIGEVIVQAQQPGDYTYSAAAADYVIQVGKRPLTVTAVNQTRPYGSTNPALTASYAGFVFNEGSNVIDNPVNISTTATIGSSPGVYPINLSGGNDDHYDLTKVNGVLTITKQDQAISFLPLETKSTGSQPFLLLATSSSGLPITYESTNPLVATVSANMVTIHQVGTTVIRAQQPGNANYFAATTVEQTLTVKNPQQIIFNALSSKKVGDPSITLSATATSGLAVSFESLDPSIASINGTQLTILSAGIARIRAVQNGSALYMEATPVVQPMSISKGDQSILFPDPGSVAWSNTGTVLNATATSGLTVSFTAIGSGVSLEGNKLIAGSPGPVRIIAYQDGNQNYNVASPVERIFCLLPPTPAISLSQGEKGEAMLVSSAALGNQWYREGQPIDGAIASTFTPSASGTYTVQSHAQACLSAMSAPFEFILTGAEERSGGISVFPNPASDELHIKTAESNMETEVTVFAVSGLSLIQTSGHSHLIIDLKSLPQGNYIVRIRSGKNTVFRKVTKK